MKTYRLLHETPAHFVIHDLKDRKNFHIAKKGIDKNTSDTIKSLPPMNPDKASNYDNDMPDSRNITGTDSTPIENQPQKLEKGGDVLDATARAHIAPSNFALPGNRYPIHNIEHARNALARVSQYGTPEEKEKVRAAVHSKYPSIGKSEGGKIEEMESHRHPLPDQKIPKEQDPGVQRDLGYGFGKGDQTVHHFDEGGSVLEEIGDSISKAFAKPTPTPPPAPTQEEKNEAIRHQNLVNAGEAPGTPTESQGGEIPHYADGTDNVQAPPPDNYVMAAPKQDNYVETQSPATAQIADAAVNSAMQTLAPNTVPDPSKAINPDVPPDEVYAEQQRLGSLAGITPGTTAASGKANPLNPWSKDYTDSADPLDQFKTEAETNVAAMHQQNRSMQQKAQKNQYDASVEKVNTQNAIRAKSGLAPIPVPAPPPPTNINNTPDQQLGTTIPTDQQISTKPPSGQQDLGLGQTQDFAGNYQTALKDYGTATKNIGASQETGANDTAVALQKYLSTQQKIEAANQKENAAMRTQLTSLGNAAAQGNIDPNRYYHNMNTGSKISAALGLIFGGIGAGLTHQPNAALQVINNAIDRDVAAQQNDRTNAVNLYKVNLEKYRDQLTAQSMTRMQQQALVAGHIQQIAQQTQSKTAKQVANQLAAGVTIDHEQTLADMSYRQTQLKMLQQSAAQPQQGGINTGRLQLLQNTGLMSKDQADTATKEMEDYNQLSGKLDYTRQVFGKALSLANATNALPGPTIRPTSREYEALKDSWLGNITKSIEGRVTPQDIDLMKTSFPTYLDTQSPKVYITKLNNILDMLRDKYKFSVINNPTFGLTNPNDPVMISSATRSKRFKESKPQ